MYRLEGYRLKKKVILVIYKELEEFEYEKYGGCIFEKYFDVEVWSLPGIFSDSDVRAKELFSEQKDIKSLREFARILNRYSRKQTFLSFMFPPTQRKTFYIEAIVSIMGFQYSMSYCQPYLSEWNSGSLKEELRERKPDYVNAVLNALFPPTFNFVATKKSFLEFPSVRSIIKQNNVLIHTLDYDVYLKVRNEQDRLIDEKYIVFIDEGYVDNYDFNVFNIKQPFKKEDEYYIPVRKFFNYIEKMMGYRIIIAEHPRSYYSDRTIYGNRIMIRGQTARLIRDAEMVLCHASMAIDYNILFKKQFIVLYMNEIKRFYEWRNFYLPLFHSLNIKGLNISEKYNENMITNSIVYGDSKYCNKHKQQFIKAKGTREELFYEIVSEYILNLWENRN